MKLKSEIKRFFWCLLFTSAMALLYFTYLGPRIFKPDTGSKDVVIYTTAWCPYCARLKELLDSSDISYMERDIEQSKKSYFVFLSLGGTGVPVSVVGEEVIYGYQPEAVKSALAKLGHDID